MTQQLMKLLYALVIKIASLQLCEFIIKIANMWVGQIFYVICTKCVVVCMLEFTVMFKVST